MWGVRRKLGVRSMDAKIEERILRRIGHVTRMENNRPTKQTTLGWYVPPVTLMPQTKPRHGMLEYWRKIIYGGFIEIGRLECAVGHVESNANRESK